MGETREGERHEKHFERRARQKERAVCARPRESLVREGASGARSGCKTPKWRWWMIETTRACDDDARAIAAGERAASAAHVVVPVAAPLAAVTAARPVALAVAAARAAVAEPETRKARQADAAHDGDVYRGRASRKRRVVARYHSGARS